MRPTVPVVDTILVVGTPEGILTLVITLAQFTTRLATRSHIFPRTCSARRISRRPTIGDD